MDQRISAALELERRGKLPDHYKPVLSELRKRGAVQGFEGQKAERDQSTLDTATGLADEAADTLTFGLWKPFATGVRAGAQYLLGDDESIADNYNQQSAQYDKRRDINSENIPLAHSTSQAVGMAPHMLIPGGTFARSFAGKTAEIAGREGAMHAAGDFRQKEGEGTVEAVTRLGQEVAGDAAASAVIGYGGGKLLEKATGGLGRLQAKAAQVAGKDGTSAHKSWSYSHQNVPEFGPAMTNSGVVRGTTKAIGNSIAGSPIRNAARETLEAADERLARVAEVEGADPIEAGNNAITSMQSRNRHNIDNIKSLSDAEVDRRIASYRNPAQGNTPDKDFFALTYEKAFRGLPTLPRGAPGRGAGASGNQFFLVRKPGGTKRKTSTMSALSDIHKRLRQNGILTGSQDYSSPVFRKALSRRIGPELTEALLGSSRTGQPKPYTIEGMRRLRTDIRALKQKPKNADPAKRDMDAADLDRLYGAITDDITSTLVNIGARDRVAMIKEVDAAYRDWKLNAIAPVKRFMKEGAQGHDLFTTFRRSLSQNSYNPQFISALRRNTSSKDFDALVGALIRDMSDKGVGGFAARYEKLHPDMQKIVGRRWDVKALLNIEKDMRPFRQLADRDNAGLAITNPANIATGAGLMLGFQQALAGYGGAYLLSKVLTSPRYTKWLQAAAKSQGQRGRPNAERLLPRLAEIAAKDTDVGPAVLQSIELMPEAQAFFISGDGLKTPEERENFNLAANRADVPTYDEKGPFRRDPFGRPWKAVSTRDVKVHLNKIDKSRFLFRYKKENGTSKGTITASEIPITEIMEADELFERYPALKDTVVATNPSMRAYGLFTSRDGKPVVVLSPKAIKDEKTLKEVLVHEMQHGIQFLEENGDFRREAGKSPLLGMRGRQYSDRWPEIQAFATDSHNVSQEELDSAAVPSYGRRGFELHDGVPNKKRGD